MNADQKKRIAHEISNWKNACNCRAVQLTGNDMAALLQELVDTPEPKSCGWIRAIDEAMVTHHLGVADIVDDYEAAKKKLNTLLSLNQDIGEYFSAKAPAPSVPPVLSTGQWESSRIADYNRGWNDCRKATEKALNDLEKRK